MPLPYIPPNRCPPDKNITTNVLCNTCLHKQGNRKTRILLPNDHIQFIRQMNYKALFPPTPHFGFFSANHLALKCKVDCNVRNEVDIAVQRGGLNNIKIADFLFFLFFLFRCTRRVQLNKAMASHCQH